MTDTYFNNDDLMQSIKDVDDQIDKVMTENIKKEWIPILVNQNSSDKEYKMELTNRVAQLFSEILDDKFIKSLASKEKIKKKDNNTKEIIKSRWSFFIK